jgi:hypothetical protein
LLDLLIKHFLHALADFSIQRQLFRPPSPSAADENVSESPATNVREEKVAEDVQMGEPEAQRHPNGDAGLDYPMNVHSSVVNSEPSATSSSNTIDSNAVSTPLDRPYDDDHPTEDAFRHRRGVAC